MRLRLDLLDRRLTIALSRIAPRRQSSVSPPGPPPRPLSEVLTIDAPRPGRLIAILPAGSVVRAGQAVARVDGEPIETPIAGRIVTVLVDLGMRVEQGTPLVVLEPA
jgi:hypothetical protein